MAGLGSQSPNQREGLSAVSSLTGNNEYVYSTNHALNVNASISITGGATAANQTSGAQKTQIVDAGGDVATITGGKLDVNATASLAGTALPIAGATEAVGVAIVDSSGNQISSFGGGTQYTSGAATPANPVGTMPVFSSGGNITSVSTVDGLPVNVLGGQISIQAGAQIDLIAVNGTTISLGQAVMTSSLPVVIASNQTAIPVDGSGATQPVSGSVTANAGTNLNTSALALSATQTDKSQFTKLTDGTDTALITAAGEQNVIATAQPGVDIGDVTINNAGGAAAVNIQDGGNSITIDGTVAATQSGTWTVQPGNTANTTAWKVDGSAVTQPVSYATTGSGTATGALRVELPTNGTGVIATVGAVTAITNALPAGSNAIGKLAANSGIDIGDVDITSEIPGTGATNLGKAEDAGHTTGDTGVFALGVRNDTLADVTTTTADYSQLSTDIKGRVMTAGSPRALKANTQTALSNTTSETTIIAATASTFHDVYGLILANTGATTTKVSIRDDTAGTVRAIIEVPTLETRGFMLPVDSALPQTATNKNWTAQCGSATTALEVTALYVSMV